MSRPTALNDIRRAFLDFFAGRGHEVVPSAPLVPFNDPTLLFTNAGMVPFKNVFTGVESRPYSRAASAQKCVRAGGKHNDLDNVGYTARHHTFFEMLGNFSFGDYFKEAAIAYAWDLVHKEFALPVERLMVTVYAEDDEAFDLWRRIAGLDEDRIVRIPTSDNFWSMGDTGPCGPCSEIFYDHGPDIPGGPPGSDEEDGDRFVEIWNLVFMQFDQQADGVRTPLPKPSIDTGMGLERITAVMQGVHDNYEIDLFRTLIAASEAETGVRAEGVHRPSHRVIADHLRAVSFLIADGVLPANEGRGYVLRRIMRRAMRHAHMLGAKEPLLYRLVPTLVGAMGSAYPELARAEALVTETLRHEEERFRSMLERGLRLLDEALAKLAPGAPLPGEIAFKLYDTYGFPLDLTQDALRAEGRGVDVAGFEAAMAEQRRRARAAWAGSGEAATEAVWFDIKEETGGTEFIGYGADRGEGRVLALVKDGKPVDEVHEGDHVAVIVNQTPFYAESGGQVGDRGTITGPGVRLSVEDTKKELDSLWVHHAVVEEGTLHVGDVVTLEVDAARRNRIRANHSATHLLHAALRKHLGPHVTQKGSLVDDQRLRFDFSHPRALTAEEIDVIEAEVNVRIRENNAVETHLMSYDEAVKSGAMALFGEKYGDEVRVLMMGRDDADPERPYSVELCGGTHVRRLGDIGLFKIVSESAVAAGIRRIEALTGEAARRYLLDEERRLREAAAVIKAPPAELPERVAQLAETVRSLERELAQ
ncbi:MAG: alanine--tRNA ligase, partial [Alphaproteobacteria bacterium]